MAIEVSQSQSSAAERPATENFVGAPGAYPIADQYKLVRGPADRLNSALRYDLRVVRKRQVGRGNSTTGDPHCCRELGAQVRSAGITAFAPQYDGHSVAGWFAPGETQCAFKAKGNSTSADLSSNTRRGVGEHLGLIRRDPYTPQRNV
ncbi:hypothetical protein [Niveibacterium microcysteis]|uniref:Uncharacterized protein n=1 Tax=Niveibacterium microcysteis TaxID=2811415 RepID=A0ABX7M2W7_9RHOO|nr:hypothetical protein [Niveibacterium microcysteis]QSI75118.1 hypothetical protein JY500_11305 [Niveibacterium microcysteis]